MSFWSRSPPAGSSSGVAHIDEYVAVIPSFHWKGFLFCGIIAQSRGQELWNSSWWNYFYASFCEAAQGARSSNKLGSYLGAPKEWSCLSSVTTQGRLSWKAARWWTPSPANSGKGKLFFVLTEGLEGVITMRESCILGYRCLLTWDLLCLWLSQLWHYLQQTNKQRQETVSLAASYVREHDTYLPQT